MDWTQDTALREASGQTASLVGIFYGWWIVAASFGCLMVGINPIANRTFGVCLTPLSEEFGWSSSQAAHGVSPAMLRFTLTQSLTGTLIARYGRSTSFLGQRRSSASDCGESLSL